MHHRALSCMEDSVMRIPVSLPMRQLAPHEMQSLDDSAERRSSLLFNLWLGLRRGCDNARVSENSITKQKPTRVCKRRRSNGIIVGTNHGQRRIEKSGRP